MREFNFELAKQGHPVVRRDGIPAKIVYISDKDEALCILYVYKDEGESRSVWVDKTGQLHSNNASKFDLFMQSEKLWIAIKKDKYRKDESSNLHDFYKCTHALCTEKDLIEVMNDCDMNPEDYKIISVEI
jgi:hypothetical protein